MITYTLNEYGLRPKDMDYMLKLFAGQPEIERVILYGSRAKGTYEHGSDIDLALVGSQITDRVVSHVHYMLEEESPTLLWFDVLHYDGLTNQNLKAQIDKYGAVLYRKTTDR